MYNSYSIGKKERSSLHNIFVFYRIERNMWLLSYFNSYICVKILRWREEIIWENLSKFELLPYTNGRHINPPTYILPIFDKRRKMSMDGISQFRKIQWKTLVPGLLLSCRQSLQIY